MGIDANNYTLTPFKTELPNYLISALALNGSITGSSTTSGAILKPGSASFKNVIAGDAIGVAEVAVSIPGAVKGAKTGNTVGTFVGSQKVASLSGVDAENYSYQNVLGDYTVKTGFSSGSIIPPEMRSPSNQTQAFKDSSTATAISTLKTTIAKSETSPISSKDVAGTPEVQPSSTIAKTTDITPTLKNKNDVAQGDVKTLAKVQAKASATARQVVATVKAPIMVSALTGGSLDFSDLGTISDAQGKYFSQGAPTPTAQESNSSIENNDSLEASIYEFIGNVLANPSTLQLLGGASSLAFLAKTLLGPTITINVVNAPANTPNRTPVRDPYQPASNANNRFNNRFSRKA